jgi:PH domain
VLLGSQLDDGSLHTVAEFLSTDIVKKHDPTVLDKRRSVSPSTSTNSPTHNAGLSGVAKDTEPPKKEGYLTKRGKNFGGWQPRYFVLDGPQLKYFDAVYYLKCHTNASQMEFISAVLNYLRPKSVGKLRSLEKSQMIVTMNK